MKKNENSYKKSGVNISLANKLVKYISNISKKNVKLSVAKVNYIVGIVEVLYMNTLYISISFIWNFCYGCFGHHS